MAAATLSAPPTAPVAVRSGRRGEDLVAFEKAVVDFFVEAAELLAVPKSVAVLYGIVFASPRPLSFSDIEGRTELSKGSISQGLRVLREMGAIKEVSTAADRTELFVPDLELRRLIQRFLEQRLKQQLDAGKTRLGVLQRALPELEKSETEILRARVKRLRSWHTKARALLPVARTFLNLSPG